MIMTVVFLGGTLSYDWPKIGKVHISSTKPDDNCFQKTGLYSLLVEQCGDKRDDILDVDPAGNPLHLGQVV